MTRLLGGTLADGRVVDVTLQGDRVASVTPTPRDPHGPDAALPSGDDVLDLRGYVLLTAPAEPHAHLDKALSWEVIQPPMGDLGLAIASWRVFAATTTREEVEGRAQAAALLALSHGTTALRTHVDVLSGDDPLRGVRALVAVRERLRDLMDIELVALAGPETPDVAVEAALDAGVDLVGGACHLALDEDADLDRLLSIAQRYGVGVDLHVDESLVHGTTMRRFADRTLGWSVNRTASHCVRLGAYDPVERDEIIGALLRSGIGVVANPITNLYLQGWDHEHLTPRGLAPLRALLDAGVVTAAGADNIRDPFNPMGRGDTLETAMLAVVAGHLTIDEAYAAVSTGARRVMGLPEAGVLPGARAELMAVRGASLAEVVAAAPADRFVVHAGRIVASTTTTRTLADLTDLTDLADPPPAALAIPDLEGVMA
ncbi:MAG: amidohydrolase family protein [Lapillicoccus sp.]